jgi:hypothetical protein
MGEAMGLVSSNRLYLATKLRADHLPQPYARSFDQQSAPLSFLGALLGIVGLSDLIAISMPEEISSYHWGSQGMLSLSLSSHLLMIFFH